MIRSFCTLFDKNYLYKGLALHDSLLEHVPDFKLWILCLDDLVFKILKKMNLAKVELIQLSALENPELLSVKAERNVGEYSWTCKSYLMSYIFNKYCPESLAYLDSDLYFFASPEKLYQELESKSIAITPHRFPVKIENWADTRGRYNAGWIFFRNDEVGKECLEWWRKQCLNWCFQRYEEGKFGDQKYLDQFQNLFPETYDIINPGINLGPWSLEQYKTKKIKNKILVNQETLVIFHFHSLKIYYFLGVMKFSRGNYRLPSEAIKIIYAPYEKKIKTNFKKIKKIDKNFNHGFSNELNPINRIGNFLKRKLRP